MLLALNILVYLSPTMGHLKKIKMKVARTSYLIRFVGVTVSNNLAIELLQF